MKAGNITIRRLRKASRILRAIKNPTAIQADHRPLFTMQVVLHDCGTPACVIGHYGIATPERFEIQDYKRFSCTVKILVYKEGGSQDYLMTAFKEFPGLSGNEIMELFSTKGCGEAQNPFAAADYIDNFIAYKLAQG